MRIDTLESAPSLAKIFVRAALPAIPGFPGGGRAKGLPERALRLEVDVDRDHLIDYQRLCGFAVNDVLPHTYPHILGFGLQAQLMAGNDFPMPLPGLVHLRNEITVERPVQADDHLTITVHAQDLRAHRAGRAVDLITEVEVAGEVAWRGRSTYLHRGKKHADAPVEPSAPTLPETSAAAVLRLPSDLGRRYGSISGDVNPIHLHPLTARAMGFPTAIAHGMWTYARTVAALNGQGAGPSTSRVWFTKPVALPSTVELVVAAGEADVVAGLRSPKESAKNYLALTLN